MNDILNHSSLRCVDSSASAIHCIQKCKVLGNVYAMYITQIIVTAARRALKF